MSILKNNVVHILYFNGLGSGKIRRHEQCITHYLAKRGIEVTHVPIDWRSGESFEKLFDLTTKLIKQTLDEHDELVLVGASAGGSLAINIFGLLQNENLSVVTLCSRLNEVPLPWWDRRTLKRLAHMGIPGRESHSFFDSVMHCTNVTIPKLTEKDKKRITIATAMADEVVPRMTMPIDGVRIYRLPIFGHGLGIILGLIRLPKMVDRAK